MSDPIQNLPVEREVLGSLMVTTAARVQAIQVDTGLKADHFFYDRHRLIFDAIVTVAGEADPDALLVLAELERRSAISEAGGSNYPLELTGTVAAPGNVLHHAKTVIEAADWRMKQQGYHLIGEAIEGRDKAKMGEGEALLTKEIVHAGSTYNPAALQVIARKLMTEEGAEVFPWPLGDLNELTDGGMRRGEFVCLGGHTSHGKALAVDTPIPTPSGWRNMADLEPDDQVFDQDGKPCRIMAVTEVMENRPCFEVKFSDGSRIVADAEHQWETWDTAARMSESAGRRKKSRTSPYSNDQRGKRIKPGVRTTREIAETLTKYGGGANHSIPVSKPLMYPQKKLSIDPYILGAWLGDGTSRAAQTTCHADDLEHFVNEFESAGEKTKVRQDRSAMRIQFGSIDTCCRGHEPEPGQSRCRLCRNNAAKAFHKGIAADELAPPTHFTAQARLRQMNLLQNKHIPENYQRSSVPQRMALMQGIMDTDGTVSSRGKCEIVVTNERLARDILELALGLGFRATLTSRDAKLNGRVCGTAYLIGFVTTSRVCRLPRKLERIPAKAAKANHRYIQAVNPVESVAVKCIQVDSPRSLYLAGENCIPTHNSVLLDQTLNGLTNMGKRCHAYLNEMSIEERVARALARTTGISYSKIIRNRLSNQERETVMAAAPKALAFGLTSCAGWSAEEIGHHIRRNRWDVAAIDILHLIPHEDTKDLEKIAGTFATVAQQANCTILATVHLNRNRIKTAKTPRPTNADIKGSSAFEQNANTICFVHRDQNDRGILKATGAAFLTKVRNGRLGETWVTLNGEQYRFEPKVRADAPPINTPPDEPMPVAATVKEEPLPF